MPTTELTRFATYCRSMATSVDKTIAMARQDLADARAAAREGDRTHPLTPEQALAIKCGLQREHALWLQLAAEIDAHLDRDLTPTDDAPALFTEPRLEPPTTAPRRLRDVDPTDEPADTTRSS